MVTLKFKKLHPDAKLPTKHHTTDTGFDIYAVEEKRIRPHDSAEVETGIQVAYIQPGYWYQVSPRSGLGFKHSLQPHLGTIDQDYRGHLSVKLYNFSDIPYHVQAGDRIAQLIVYPLVEAETDWTDEEHKTERGEKGLGSSGR